VTRELWCRRQLERDESNDSTVCLRSLALAPRPQRSVSFGELFRSHYAAIRGLLEGRVDPGLGILVASPGGIEASGWLPAQDGLVTPLILGRHTSADVLLPSDPRLSLRQLALVLHRKAEERAVTFRVLDLRTPLALTDETGERLEAIEASGPVFLWSGSLGLLLFPTGEDSAEWPQDPEVAWSRVPERRYAATAASPNPGPSPGLERRHLSPLETRTTTTISTFAGPVFPSLAPDPSEPPRGELLVTSGSGRVALRLGGQAARRGVLLGRYERCDTSGLPVLTDPALSRVHLLVVEIDGVLYGIDTASKNGSWNGEDRVRAVSLRPGLRVHLADKATVEWRPFH
jgi:hypothetical protein